MATDAASSAGPAPPPQPNQIGGETGAAAFTVRVLPYAGETDARRIHAGDWLF